MRAARIYEFRAERRCLVCESVEEAWEPSATDVIGPSCTKCRAPTERVRIIERRRIKAGVNPHAAALGRLGGIKGGRARAVALSAHRRHLIAVAAARARWNGR